MRIKEIGIQGFKSFVDRTSLVLGAGISCVVGPNGCGKSNVIDAIKWVIGEQNARSLRGAAMADIIFAGTERRAPVGMAEVTLTLTNEGGGFPGAWEAFSELEVTRRLYRSGESEYLINRLTCRLRDIHDLFLDTGVGGKVSYAIIEQGRVEQLISSRPEERRRIIEEAAGISRYKARRDEALKRLDQTQQNLLRVADLVAELKKQLASLERQAKRAEEYVELFVKVRRLDLLLGLVKLGSLEADLRRVDTQVARLKDVLADHLEALGGLERQVGELREKLGEEGRLLGQLRDALSQAESEKKLKEGTSALHRRELDGLERRAVAFAADVERYQARAEEARAGLHTAEAELRQVEGTLETAEADRQDRELRLAEAVRAQKDLGGRLESGKQRLVQQLTEAARIHNHLANLDQRGRELDGRAERNRAEADRLRATLDEVVARHQALEATAADAQARKDATRQAMEARRAQMAAVEEEIRIQQTRTDEMRRELNLKASRLHSLKELERDFEGFETGARAVLTQHPTATGLKTVADVLQVPRRFEAAAEAALGPRLQWVVVDKAEGAVELITWLRGGDRGRASFVPQDGEARADGVRAAGPGIVGPLASHLGWDPRYDAIAGALLADLWVVEELPQALDAWRKAGRRGTFVTLAGDVVDERGGIHGGSGPGGGILRKKGEIRELAASVRALEGELEERAGALEDLKLRRLDAVEEIDALRIRLHEGELELVRLERDLTQVRAEDARLSQTLKVLELDGRQMGIQRDELAREQETSRGRVKALDGERSEQEGELARLDKELAAVRRTHEDAQEALTVLRVKVAEAATRREEVRRDLVRRRVEIEEIDLTLERRRREIQEAAQQREHIERELAEADEAIVRLTALLEELERDIAKGSRGYSQTRFELSRLEESLAERRRLMGDEERKLKDASIQQAELKLQVEHVVTGTLERHEVDLRALAVEIRVPTPASAGEEVAAGDEAASAIRRRLAYHRSLEADALREPLAEVLAAGEGIGARLLSIDEEAEGARKRLARIGSVDLEAIHQFAEVKERYDFTCAQEADLQASVEDIKKTILRINRTSRERFREAFAAINGHFQVIFPKIFEGGSARLVLTDPENLLETGVEIEVQPPGKKVQNMNLLSGGEKAMTAVALIFALFRVRPSPFCILDEVDAPLDEANSHRFHEVVKELAEVSQFIVITHNKRTMEVADTLYGVTMEEPGVSRLVTVDLS